MRVLVVDDHEDTVQWQVLLLRSHGYEVQGCHCGSEALEVIERFRPEVILLDLSMPQISGYDVAEVFQHNPALRPKCLIAVTGHGYPGDLAKTKKAGFDHHLLKPVHWRDLKPILQSCCDSLPAKTTRHAK